MAFCRVHGRLRCAGDLIRPLWRVLLLSLGISSSKRLKKDGIKPRSPSAVNATASTSSRGRYCSTKRMYEFGSSGVDRVIRVAHVLLSTLRDHFLQIHPNGAHSREPS